MRIDVANAGSPGRAAVATALALLLAGTVACADREAAEGLDADTATIDIEREAIRIPAPPDAEDAPRGSTFQEPIETRQDQARTERERPSEERPAAQAVDDDRVRILVAGIPVWVEIADNPEAREQGLMFRDSLADDEGMLFVYPSERILSFWMRNTPLALDIAFLDRTGRIVDIQQLEPFDEETTSSRQPAMYALEVRRGWFEDHGVGVGDRVEF